ncbi:unnamed protein product [Phytophthora fragariaefolia]|uniref:Unnamed protein product n=1 Tax=Phytophthora fragariaefolia TaxID=1490495 RepID=A0A9W7D2S5_9STRA|nr:unnamed protein product [Phytophthora fragariaefolia]
MVSLAQVHPGPFSHSPGIHHSTSSRFYFDPVRAWQQLHVSYYGGKYSIHRAFALRAYSKKSSMLRSLFLVMATPLPTVLFVVVEELIPLQNPEDGWVKNYGFWIRTAMLVFVVGHTNSGQARYLVDAVNLSECQAVLLFDFFNAIYMATCMESASSPASVVAMTVLDLTQTSASLYGLHRQTRTLQLKLHRVVGNSSDTDDLLTMVCTLCQDVKKFKRQVKTDIQIRSCFPHELDASDRYTLENLKSNANNSGRLSTYRSMSFLRGYRKHSITPNGNNNVASTDRRISARASMGNATHQLTHPTILKEALEALFTIECIILTAYLEAAIPWFYCCYVLVLVNFPSAQYHTEMASITRENAAERVTPLFFFGLLQLISFGVLVQLIKHGSGMRAIHHLAFVLDNHMPLIQGKLTLWMAVTVCCRVVHFGKCVPFLSMHAILTIGIQFETRSSRLPLSIHLGIDVFLVAQRTAINYSEDKSKDLD